MIKVFISYRRLPSAMLATLLEKALKRRRIKAFVDTRSIDGAGPFPDRLRREIEDADIFVCLLADTTLESDWVRQEIQHAHEQGKPLIPVFQESYQPSSDPDAHVSALLQCDGIHFFDAQSLYIDDAIRDLANMIKMTPEVKESASPPSRQSGYLGSTAGKGQSYPPGTCFTFFWTTNGAREVYFDGQRVSKQGQAERCPTESRSYILHVVFHDGSPQDFSSSVQIR